MGGCTALLRACRWLAVAIACATGGGALCYACHELYFGVARLSCDDQLDGTSRHAIETFIGAVPMQARIMLMGFAARAVCRKASGVQGDGGMLAVLFTVGADGDAETVFQRAGWEAIVGRPIGQMGDGDGGDPQSTWEQARAARNLTQRRAVTSAITKLLLWHWSQPVAYLWMLFPYRCYIASLGEWQPRFAAVVAAREVVYLGSTLLAAWQCPVFLLMDPICAWQEADGLERVQRAAMYVLTPHNYTAVCLANRFRGWRRLFLGLAGIQILADLCSCCALAALMAGRIAQETAARTARQDMPTAIIIGYVITASGFLLFFGPLSVMTCFRGFVDTSRHKCTRAALGLSGAALVCALVYIVVLYVMLIGDWFNPYCDGFTFNSDPCNGHGQCYGVGQCRCNYGYGPELSYSGEPLCSQDRSPCTGFQLSHALAAGDNTCCFDHGNITSGGCHCALGFGPESIADQSEYELTDGMRKNLGEPLCGRSGVVCTADQLARALAIHEPAGCGGPHFPGSRLLTPEWGQQLNDWVNMSATQQWSLCFSSFTDDVATPATFHVQCDQYNHTLSVVHNTGNRGSNQGNYTFGGFAAGSWGIDQCCQNPRNDCEKGYCYAHAASQDFLFGLWNPEQPEVGPQRFLPNRPPPKGISAHEFQRVEPTSWPRWGMGNSNTDLILGGNQPVGGGSAHCDQGHSYAGSQNEICGGYGWGPTELEVWRPTK
jgi:hypothetical protein